MDGRLGATRQHAQVRTWAGGRGPRRKIFFWRQIVVLFGGLFGLAGLVTAAQQPPPLPVDRFADACARRDPNPWLVTTCFPRGGTFEDQAAIVAFHDTANGNDHLLVASNREVGATYGLAYDGETGTLYAGAYHKRGTHFGPAGPGGIYAIDLRSRTVRTFAVVPNAGADVHTAAGDYFPDTGARNLAGKTSLGDVDLSSDGTELYAMNLADRRIYRFRTADGVLLGSFPHGAAGASWANEARPFGLGFQKGRLYHGVVRSAQGSQNERQLQGFVYSSLPDGTELRQESQADLAFGRGEIWQGEGPASWNPWRDPPGYLVPRVGRYPMPLLSDIVWSAAGDRMILGFRDRFGDGTFATVPPNQPPTGERINNVPAGDILPADPIANGWRIQTLPEFFVDDFGPFPNGGHDETSFGGIAVIPWVDRVVMTANSPTRINSAGAVWLNLATGRNVARETLYNLGDDTFGKSNGLGDVELICDLSGRPTPTPTAAATLTPTPTETPVPTQTPRIITATPVPTPTETPTPETYRIYLPYGENGEKCVPDAYHTDVVLVLDRSTSMLRSIEEGGIPKNEAAINAAKEFVALLDYSPDGFGRHDQVAVVGFNDTAWIEQDLTNDPVAALQKLEGLRNKTQEGTRLDLAFERGQEPLSGPHHKPENRPVMIVLTDGIPNRVPFPTGGRQEDTVLAKAVGAKAKGTRVYTIGLGKPRDLYPKLMIAAATERWMYYYAPKPEDLSGIYKQIAATFDDCNPHRFPIVLPCVPEDIYTDAVLVLDMSTSMYRTTSAGRTKQQAAVEAGKEFVALLDLEPDGFGRQDQVAIVGFNDDAWIGIGLSDEKDAVLRALDELPLRSKEGTRLDLAFKEGELAMESPRRNGDNRPVMILLTDGLPNRVPFPAGGRQEDTVLAAAKSAKDKGTILYTIGLGQPEDISEALLKGCATDPALFYYAPDGEDLARIYREIAGRISECPPLAAAWTAR